MALFKLTNNSDEMINIEYDNPGLSEFYNNIDPTSTISECFIADMAGHSLYKYKLINDYLCIFNRKKELVTIPFNKEGEVLNPKELIDVMKENSITKIANISSRFIELNKVYLDVFKARRLPSYGSEYVYNNRELSALEGGDWSNLRNKRNKCKNKYNIKVVEYESSMINDALKAYQNWYETQGSKLLKKGEEIWDKNFFKLAISKRKELNHIIFLIYVDDEVAGLVSFEIVNKKLVYGVFRKINPNYKYLSQYMQWWQADYLWNNLGIEYLNDGNDSADEGLGKLKSGFHPQFKFDNYSLSIKK